MNICQIKMGKTECNNTDEVFQNPYILKEQQEKINLKDIQEIKLIKFGVRLDQGEES